MRLLKILLLIATLAVVSLLSQSANAATDVSVGVNVSSVDEFYEPLGSHGYWVDVSTYGRCWRPAYVESYWRPYSYGTWVWTDWGWYWESDEPWAWACYHYGRWVYDPYYGWVWVPDTVWGPAWVSFREGGGYIGWAPLPPGPYFTGGVIVVERDVVPWSWFVFVGSRHFCEPIQPRTVIVNNITIVNKTRNITRIREVNKTIINEGPRADAIQRVNRAPLRTGRVSQLIEREKIPPSFRREMQRAREQPQRQRQNQPERPQIKQPPPQAQPAVPQPSRERGRRPEIIRGTPGSPPAQAEPRRGPPPGKGPVPPPERQERPPPERKRPEKPPGGPEEGVPGEEPHGRER
jgi:hypothetical protein